MELGFKTGKCHRIVSNALCRYPARKAACFSFAGCEQLLAVDEGFTDPGCKFVDFHKSGRWLLWTQTTMDTSLIVRLIV